MPPSQTDIDEEQLHFSNVISTFQNYANYSLSANNRRRKDLYTLPKADQELLSQLGYRAKLDAVDEAISKNADFLGSVVADPEIFGHDIQDEEDHSSGHSHDHSHGGQHHHGHSHSHGGTSTLKQLVRDWSAEGKAERDACYLPMTEALLSHYSDITENMRRNLRVLVPGAGLGRLAHDVAKLGFASQGNEFSHYMLLTSHFILNQTTAVDAHTIYPYVHSFSNLPTSEALLRPVTLPDVLPSSLPKGVNFSLVAGDFEEIYGSPADPSEPHAGLWDAILTCFFIDTAKNIVNYLRILHAILAPGGVWINLGPLLWHWENNNTHDPSVELSLDEVKTLARQIGFVIENERSLDTTYTNNPQSMLGYVYKAAFWTARKKREGEA
ncbi:N2227 domain-containing protein [Mycena indigotica]|uniref:carnosine N-methyltransferase n=1 Tax=Mycena indigotica TaxID=2126181 RepID=A0A8H6T414_9AGAR|nr:N2227 domain-containing protein [Mycena indigotica]KAF7309952.1 N2227 domain-containing protein [Mycena indigotica]